MIRAAITEPLPVGGCDAAVATLALSTVPVPERAVRRTHDALRPGGRFLVLDVRPFEDGLATTLSPVLSRLFRRVSAWKQSASRRVQPGLRSTFESGIREASIPPGVGFCTAVEKGTESDGEVRLEPIRNGRR